MKKQRLAAAGLIAGLTAGGLGGLALGAPAVSFAQDATDSTTAPAADADHASRLLETLQPLIDDGTLTQAQADAVIGALEAARPAVGPGDHGRGGRGLDSAAAAIGISVDELRQALTDGSTIAEVAQSNGVDVQTVVDAMVADLQAHLAEEVASGEHTQAEADEKIANANERITAMVNGEMPAGPPR